MSEAWKVVELESFSRTELELLRRKMRRALDMSGVGQDHLDEIIMLGFTAQSVVLLPLIPLIQVAWADGKVDPKEKKSIIQAAHELEIELHGEARDVLDNMFIFQPGLPFAERTLHLLNRIYDAQARGDGVRSKRDLMQLTLAVARASGGVMGLGNKVCKEERELIELLSEKLGVSAQVQRKP